MHNRHKSSLMNSQIARVVLNFVVHTFDMRCQRCPLIELLAAVASEDLTRMLVGFVGPKRLLGHRHERTQVAAPLSSLLRVDVADQMRGDAVLECRAVAAHVTEEVFEFQVDALDVLLEIVLAGYQQPALRTHLL